jgi:hypothetical protein
VEFIWFYQQIYLFYDFPLILDVNRAQLVAFIWFPCRLPCDQVWCAYDVAVCVLYYHNVCFVYIERDTDPHAEVYRFVYPPFFFSSCIHKFCHSSHVLQEGFESILLLLDFLMGESNGYKDLRGNIIRVHNTSSFLVPFLKIPFCQFIAVQLQHHARHRLPTFQLIFVHVIESLVFVPVSIHFYPICMHTLRTCKKLPYSRGLGEVITYFYCLLLHDEFDL